MIWVIGYLSPTAANQPSTWELLAPYLHQMPFAPPAPKMEAWGWWHVCYFITVLLIIKNFIILVIPMFESSAYASTVLSTLIFSVMAVPPFLTLYYVLASSVMTVPPFLTLYYVLSPSPWWLSPHPDTVINTLTISVMTVSPSWHCTMYHHQLSDNCPPHPDTVLSTITSSVMTAPPCQHCTKYYHQLSDDYPLPCQHCAKCPHQLN